jgi:hypothetical protein
LFVVRGERDIGGSGKAVHGSVTIGITYVKEENDDDP